MTAARHGQARLASIRLGERRVGLGGPALRCPPGRRIEQAAGRVDVAHEIGARVLDGLVAADRTSALDARLRVLDHELEHALRAAHHLGRTRQRPRAER